VSYGKTVTIMGQSYGLLKAGGNFSVDKNGMQVDRLGVRRGGHAGLRLGLAVAGLGPTRSTAPT